MSLTGSVEFVGTLVASLPRRVALEGGVLRLRASMIRYRGPVLVGLLMLLASCRTPPPVLVPHVATNTLPTRVSDVQFGRLMSEFSEPGGSFPTDNFVSNEEGFQRVMPRLTRT